MVASLRVKNEKYSSYVQCKIHSSFIIHHFIILHLNTLVSVQFTFCFSFPIFSSNSPSSSRQRLS